jgi:hypothetical protein
MKRYLAICFLAALLHVNSSFAEDSRFSRAEIYYYGWNVMTRARLSLADVRKNPRIATTITDAAEATGLAGLLDLSAPSSGNRELRDPRLVIDLWSKAGARTTYFSDGISLCAEDGSACRPIDENFRRRFTFLAGK